MFLLQLICFQTCYVSLAINLNPGSLDFWTLGLDSWSGDSFKWHRILKNFDFWCFPSSAVLIFLKEIHDFQDFQIFLIFGTALCHEACRFQIFTKVNISLGNSFASQKWISEIPNLTSRGASDAGAEPGMSRISGQSREWHGRLD